MSELRLFHIVEELIFHQRDDFWEYLLCDTTDISTLRAIVKILKSQLAAEFTLCKDHISDFWKYLPVMP